MEKAEISGADICLKAENYLRAKNLYPEKIEHQYLGTVDAGIAPFDKESKFTIVSCANVIPLKRIDLIIDIIEALNFSVKWVHFGGGSEFEKIRAYAKKIGDKHEVVFTDIISNSEIFNYYTTNTVHLFISTSSTESLPVSIQEAISFGIPILATDVGGMSEVVCDKTGILTDVDIDIEDVASAILKFKSSEMNSLEFRKEIRQYWLEKFEAKKNLP